MISYMIDTAVRARRTAVVFALAVMPVVACSSTDEILSVTDPDIINPADVQSAAGANAVRLGALTRLNQATSGQNTAGTESLFLLGGLFSDEWNNGDSFIARQEVDQRVITIQNNFLTDANRALHRARLAAVLAIDLLREWNPTGPASELAEMYLVQAYVENIIAEHYCNGIIISTVKDGETVYGDPITVTETLDLALAHADSGLALITGTAAADVRIRNALRVVKGRILVNLNRQADAATAVNGVPTTFRYEMFHSQATNDNQFWAFNNNARRYSVGPSEGTNGLNFASAADPRLPVCQGGDAACRGIGVTSATRDDLARPIVVQMLWPGRESRVAIITGIEARLIEAEAQLRAGNAAGALTTLNALRAPTGAGSGGVTGLAALTDAGSTDARVNQLFRERAFWLFGRGHRVGDLRRLIRQYSRAANSVFPTGAWHKSGNYGNDVTLPIPQAERNNPNVTGENTCLDRNA